MKIKRLRVTSYRGIADLDASIAPAGAIVKGRNGGGKTSVLRSIRAALAAQDIAPDAIRQDEDRAEIVVDLDDHTVKRVITAKGSTLTVEKAGLKASKPTTYLTELLGTAPLDPLDLYLAKPKEQKAIILGALPVTVTREQLEKYAGELPIDFNFDGHGLEVVERARKYFYDERTAANKDAADAKRTAERLADEAKTAAQAVTPGPLVPADDAKAAVAAAERELLTLENRAKDAAAAETRTADQRARIAELRAEADDADPGERAVASTADLEAELAGARDEVAEFEAKLAAARVRLEEATRQLADVRAKNQALQEDARHARSLREQAAALEAALAAATVAAPSAEDLSAATTKLANARQALDRAALQAAALAAAEAADVAKKNAKALEAEADELDAIVTRLANDAPTELLKSANAIPGLSIDGDDVLLDGKRLSALCGQEQLALAVEIARRANAKTKILVCDGLERLDPEQMDAFVAQATRDGWQLIGTRVDRGAVVIEAIEPDETAAAAE